MGTTHRANATCEARGAHKAEATTRGGISNVKYELVSSINTFLAFISTAEKFITFLKVSTAYSGQHHKGLSTTSLRVVGLPTNSVRSRCIQRTLLTLYQFLLIDVKDETIVKAYVLLSSPGMLSHYTLCF